MIAASAATSAARASLRNMLNPGVSSRLILVFFHSMAAIAGGDRQFARDLLFIANR